MSHRLLYGINDFISLQIKNSFSSPITMRVRETTPPPSAIVVHKLPPVAVSVPFPSVPVVKVRNTKIFRKTAPNGRK